MVLSGAQEHRFSMDLIGWIERLIACNGRYLRIERFARKHEVEAQLTNKNERKKSRGRVGPFVFNLLVAPSNQAGPSVSTCLRDTLINSDAHKKVANGRKISNNALNDLEKSQIIVS